MMFIMFKGDVFGVVKCHHLQGCVYNVTNCLTVDLFGVSVVNKVFLIGLCL